MPKYREGIALWRSMFARLSYPIEEVHLKRTIVLAAALCVAFAAQAQEEKKKAAKAAAGGPKSMTFFVTSVGKGNGADLGGLEGADAYCASLAKAAGASATNW